jgi:hypothetical protein
MSIEQIGIIIRSIASIGTFVAGANRERLEMLLFKSAFSKMIFLQKHLNTLIYWVKVPSRKIALLQAI